MHSIKNAFLNYFYDSPNIYHRLGKIGLLLVPLYLAIFEAFIYFIELFYKLNLPSYSDLQHSQKLPYFVFDTIFIFLFPIISTLIYQKWIFGAFVWIFNKMGFEDSLGQAFVLNLASNIVICIFALFANYDHFITPFLRLPFCILLTWLYVSHWMEFENKWKAYWITCGTFIIKNAWIVALNYFFALVF